MIKFTPLRYNDTYEYPRWALAVGLCLGFSSVIMVPLWCFYSLARKRGELKHVRTSLHPFSHVYVNIFIRIKNLLCPVDLDVWIK